MKILCTICARGNSKGIKNKNIKFLNGYPLIKYTIEQALNSKIFDEIVVSSDSNKILTLAKKYGVHNLILRPKELASDKAGKLESIKHALKKVENQNQNKYDVVIDLDVTSPLRKVSDIKKALSLFLKSKASTVISATPSKKNPYYNQVTQSVKGVKLVKSKKAIFRRQDAPKIYDLNASIYIYRRSSLIKSKTIYTKHSQLYIMPEERSIDIDNMLDFQLVEYLMKKNDD